MPKILVDFFNLLIVALEIAIFVRIIMSWFDSGGQSAVSRIAREITEPILGPIRRILPNLGMIDLSPLVALLLLQLIQNMVLSVS